MTKRINLLEKGKTVITYKKVGLFLGLWVLFCLGIFLIESGYGVWLGKSLKKKEQVLEQLNARKEKTMALLEASKVTNVVPEVKKLSEVFDNFPQWSYILKILSEKKPAHIWLTEVSSSYLSQNSMLRRLEISGKGQNSIAIAKFVQELNNSNYFQNFVLHNSTKNEGLGKTGYSFVLIGEAQFEGKEWN